MRRAKKPSDYVLSVIAQESKNEYVLAWAKEEIKRREDVRASTRRYFMFKKRKESKTGQNTA